MIRTDTGYKTGLSRLNDDNSINTQSKTMDNKSFAEFFQNTASADNSSPQNIPEYASNSPVMFNGAGGIAVKQKEIAAQTATGYYQAQIRAGKLIDEMKGIAAKSPYNIDKGTETSSLTEKVQLFLSGLYNRIFKSALTIADTDNEELPNLEQNIGSMQLDPVQDRVVDMTEAPVLGSDSVKALSDIKVNGSADEKRRAVVNQARKWIGKIPYKLTPEAQTVNLNNYSGKNGKPPSFLDCSSFTSSVFLTELGINIGRTTYTQVGRGTGVPMGKTPDATGLKVGDLILFDYNGAPPGHVGIYAGKNANGTNTYIHESSSGGNVVTGNLDGAWARGKVFAVRRIIQDDGTIRN